MAELTCGRSAGRQFGVDVVVGADERERVVTSRRLRAVVATGGRRGVAVPAVVAVQVEADVAQEPGRRRVAAQRSVARPARVASSAVADETLLVGAERHGRVDAALANVLQQTHARAVVHVEN